MLKLLMEPELEPRSPISQVCFARWRHSTHGFACVGQIMNYTKCDLDMHCPPSMSIPEE